MLMLKMIHFGGIFLVQHFQIAPPACCPIVLYVFFVIYLGFLFIIFQVNCYLILLIHTFISYQSIFLNIFAR